MMRLHFVGIVPINVKNTTNMHIIDISSKENAKFLQGGGWKYKKMDEIAHLFIVISAFIFL